MFENLNEVSRANTKKASGRKKAQFQIKVYVEKGIILFSAEQFTLMNIADNSLSQFIDNTGNVFLAVMPGNSGSFAKTNQRGTKGKKFKNVMLIENLSKGNYDVANLGLVNVGEEDGKTLYQITGNDGILIGDETVEAKVDAEPQLASQVEDAPTQGQEDAASFEARVDEPIVEKGADVAQEEAIEDALTADSTSPSDEELEF